MNRVQEQEILSPNETVAQSPACCFGWSVSPKCLGAVKYGQGEK